MNDWPSELQGQSSSAATQTKTPVRATGASVSAGGPTAIGGPSSENTQLSEPVKSLLPPGLFMTDDHRYYFNGEGPFPSVTTVIDVLSKPALITWKAKEAARAMLKAMVSQFEFKSEEDAILFALKEADKARDTAASIGSSVHLLANMQGMAPEASVIDSAGFQVGSDTQPYLEAFRSFLGRYSASSIVSSEKAIWNLNGYAGTFDLLMLIPCEKHRVMGIGLELDCPERELWLIDIKTSKGYYPEYGLQLAAYAHGDYIILPNDPHPYTMPLIHRTGVLHLRPDQYPDTGWRLIEYPTTGRDYIAFLGALEVHQWREEKRFSRQKLIGT